MARLNVLNYPHPVLTQKAAQVLDFNQDLHHLILDMIETMHAEDGVGLAAPQIGVSKQVIVISPTAKKGEEHVLINPKIIERSKDEEVGIEGCLSLPDFSVEVARAKRIKIEAQNLNGKIWVDVLTDFPARVVQHEIDHLNGILLTDYAQVFAKKKTGKAKLYRM